MKTAEDQFKDEIYINTNIKIQDRTNPYTPEQEIQILNRLNDTHGECIARSDRINQLRALLKECDDR